MCLVLQFIFHFLKMGLFEKVIPKKSEVLKNYFVKVRFEIALPNGQLIKSNYMT